MATEYKLPVLYLIDSIVKNVGHEYTGLFSHSIVNIFCGVFEKVCLCGCVRMCGWWARLVLTHFVTIQVNEKVRTKMYALRQTWNDVFSQPKLYALDLKVNNIDRAWPITAKVAPAIHVNPNFLKTQVNGRSISCRFVALHTKYSFAFMHIAGKGSAIAAAGQAA